MGLEKLKEKGFTKRDIIKFSKASIKVYNNLCACCKVMVQRNPSLSYDKYCPSCQKKAKEYLGDFIE